MSAWLANQASGMINPLFVVLILEQPLLYPNRRFSASLLFWLRALIGIGIAVALAEFGKYNEVWPGHPLFPSGHTTFATAAATTILCDRGHRWAWLVVPLVALMGVSLVRGHWHTPDEVAGGLVLGTAIPLLVDLAYRRIIDRRPSTRS